MRAPNEKVSIKPRPIHSGPVTDECVDAVGAWSSALVEVEEALAAWGPHFPQ